MSSSSRCVACLPSGTIPLGPVSSLTPSALSLPNSSLARPRQRRRGPARDRSTGSRTRRRETLAARRGSRRGSTEPEENEPQPEWKFSRRRAAAGGGVGVRVCAGVDRGGEGGEGVFAGVVGHVCFVVLSSFPLLPSLLFPCFREISIASVFFSINISLSLSLCVPLNRQTTRPCFSLSKALKSQLGVFFWFGPSSTYVRPFEPDALPPSMLFPFLSLSLFRSTGGRHPLRPAG